MSASLLLLPGNMCDARLWAPVGRRLDAAGLRWTVADLASGQATIAAMASSALAAAPARITPVGFSMGAIVALEMWRQAPERIEALGLIALNAGADLPDRAAARPRQQADVRDGGLARVVGDELKPNYLAASHRDDQALRAMTMAMAMALGADSFVDQSEALRTRPDLRPVLSTIDVPVLLACGAEDRLCPPDWHHRWASEIGPRATLAVIADAGHLLPLEQPDLLADRLIGWLHDIREHA
ncbi:MAG: alpha/beta fold hydrolase [Sphingomonas sp.]